MKKINKKSGFTVLYASLVGGLVLAVGAAILLLAIKQIALSSAGRESQFAFYAADSGMECALFINRASRIDDGENSCPDGKFPKPPQNEDCEAFLPNYSCAGLAIRDFSVDDSSNETISTFSIGPEINPGDPLVIVPPNICADIIVTRTNSNTKIVSRGYSTCIPSENRFERAIQTDF